ncbi:MAG: hypothetical protein DI562_03340 [Stenotrophomonas acidaminiphila]|nr:MAG: hypothetical protein DI562_03340 [Stenotrophomonas acidaminiphila]
MGARKFDLAIAIALVPILGTGLVLINQLGRLLFYGVPPEFLELDAYKILISSVSMVLMGATVCFLGATFYSSEDSSVGSRFTFHLIFASALTAPFWLSDLDLQRPISWPALTMVILTGIGFFFIERWIKRRKKTGSLENISDWSLVIFFGLIFVLFATTAHGYLAEEDRVSFTFIANSNDVVVGRAGELLIVKTYNSEHRSFNRDVTKLVASEGVVLETRTLD